LSDDKEEEKLIYLLAILGGFIAGFINMLAGSGSIITLSILTELLGLPGNIANATNRVGVLAQTYIGTYTFQKHGKLNITRGLPYLWPMIVGSFGGIYLATRVSNEQFLVVFKLLMVVMLFVVLVKPQRWLAQKVESKPPNYWLAIPFFFLLGVYSGFIQMGMGVFFLAAMVLGAKFELMEANALKIFVVAILTTIALSVFAWKGLVDWKVGGLIAIGQGAGGWAGGYYGSKYASANVWAYRILVFVVIGVLVKMFYSDILLLF